MKDIGSKISMLVLFVISGLLLFYTNWATFYFDWKFFVGAFFFLWGLNMFVLLKNRNT